MSGAGEPGPAAPRWHELPDRTGDPAIRRAAWQRGAIALARRLSRGRSYQFLRVLSIDRRLFRPFIAFNARLMPRGKLDRRETEAVILRTAGSAARATSGPSTARSGATSASRPSRSRRSPPTRRASCCRSRRG